MALPQALVTGGAQGIGRAVAETLAHAGWLVTGADIDGAALEAAVPRSAGVNGQVIICDCGDNLRMMQARKMR